MSLVAVLLIISIGIGLIIRLNGDTPKSRSVYIWIMMAVFIAESSLRGLSVGSDTTNYFYYFNDIKNTSWGEILRSFFYRYAMNRGTYDIGYNILQKTVQIFSGDFSFFLFISSLFFFIPFGILLNRYTQNFWQLYFVFVLYVALFNMIGMSGVRKEIALGFSILCFLYYVDKKYLKAFIFLLLGMTIHFTTLLIALIPIVCIMNEQQIKLVHIVAFLLIPIVLTFTGPILILMADAVDNEKYRIYGEMEARGGAIVFVITMELMSLFCLLAYWKNPLTERPFFKPMYAAVPLFTFFAPLIMHNGTMIRISQYFHIYLLILIPYAIDRVFQKERKIIYLLLITAMIIIALMVLPSMEYSFIWNDNLPAY